MGGGGERSTKCDIHYDAIKCDKGILSKNLFKSKIKIKLLNNDNLVDIISNNESWMGLNKPITDFLSNDNMEIAIEEWFIAAFKTFKEFRDSTPQLEWNTK